MFCPWSWRTAMNTALLRHKDGSVMPGILLISICMPLLIVNSSPCSRYSSLHTSVSTKKHPSRNDDTGRWKSGSLRMYFTHFTLLWWSDSAVKHCCDLVSILTLLGGGGSEVQLGQGVSELHILKHRLPPLYVFYHGHNWVVTTRDRPL